jgi:hypothetical protein
LLGSSDTGADGVATGYPRGTKPVPHISINTQKESRSPAGEPAVPMAAALSGDHDGRVNQTEELSGDAMAFADIDLDAPVNLLAACRP